jgi:predicted nuclease of predicted toxin-antitoxin system
MRFLVDECLGPVLADWLRRQQHDVFSAFEQARGLDDDSLLGVAVAEDRILVTGDKDFGELVFRDGRPHRGVLLLRLDDPQPVTWIAALQRVLASHADQLPARFVVVTDAAVRVVGPLIPGDGKVGP